jgi:hypothetical protein
MRVMTKEEAGAYRYGTWAGNPRGVKYDPAKCAAEVYNLSGGFRSSQCSKKNGKGPNGLYCGIHAKRYKEEG